LTFSILFVKKINDWGVAQVVEYLPSKCKAPSSIPAACQKIYIYKYECKWVIIIPLENTLALMTDFKK
jgi:hypothetical protein